MNREDLQNEEKNRVSFINSNNGMRYERCSGSGCSSSGRHNHSWFLTGRC